MPMQRGRPRNRAARVALGTLATGLLLSGALAPAHAAPAITDPPAPPATQGAIAEKYAELGGAQGRLGLPLAPEQRTGTDTWSQGFEHGEIVYHTSQGAYPVWGAIGERYAREGSAPGWLGVPTGAEQALGDTYRQNFTGGQIVWRADAGSEASAAADAPADTTSIQSCVDDERVRAGLTPLRWDATLAGVALQWTVHMAQTDNLADNPAVQQQAGGGPVAENVGWGATRPEMGQALCQLWLAAPAHRATILRPELTRTGISTVTYRSETWSTQVFAAGN
ncbi:CAP domain-containing protein [Granulicoccus phenolivorans]|nr:CAP domain-containing protein [Granulicoccus phenolivorans]